MDKSEEVSAFFGGLRATSDIPRHAATSDKSIMQLDRGVVNTPCTAVL